MKPDFESDLRGRLRDAALPSAPEPLHARIALVTSQQRLSDKRQAVVSRTWLLMPLAAMLVFATIAVSGWAGGPQPSVEPTGSGSTGQTGAVPAEAIAALTIESRVGEWCHPIGGCEFNVELAGPGGPWQGKLDSNSLGSPTDITPRLPDLLGPGVYVFRAEIHVFGDAIPEGASGPPDLGVIGTCSSEFSVTTETRRVQVALGFWLDRCSVGAIVSADPPALTAFDVLASFSGNCGEFGCEYRVRLTGPGGSWQTVLRTPKLPEELVTGSGLPTELPQGLYVLEASSHRMSDEPSPGSGHRQEESVAASCSAEFVVAADTGSVGASVAYDAERCLVTAETTAQVPEASGSPPAQSPMDTPAASPQVICEPNPTDLPGLACERAIDAALALLGDDHPPVEKVHFSHQCWSPSPSMIVDCAIQAVGIVAITVVGVNDARLYGVSGLPWTGVTATLLSPAWWYGPEYPAAPPDGRTVPIESAAMSDDRRTLVVEFFSGGCFGDDVPWLGSADEELLVSIVHVSRLEVWPSGFACVDMAYRRTYHLALPEPFAGGSVRDLNGGVFAVR